MLSVIATLGTSRADSAESVKAALALPPQPHPYLLFSAVEKPALLARIQSEPRSREVLEKFRLEARRLIHAPLDRDAPPRNLHTRFTGENDHDRWVARHLEAAVTLAFFHQMTGEVRYAAKAFEHADLVCAEESWVMSAHQFEIIYSRVWPVGAQDDQVLFSFDIGASVIAQKMALVYDWLHGALDRPQRDRIRGALLDKAIARVRGNYDYHWWASAYRCNWSGICHSGIGLAALALRHEDPQLADVIARSHEGVAAMLDRIGMDGGWQEGRSYWAYGVGESTPFIEALRRATGDAGNLFRHRALAQRPGEFALFGLSAGFGDGSAGPVGSSAMLNKLARESGDPQLAWYTGNFVRQGETLLDLLWPPSGLRSEPPREGSRHFASIDWAVLRRDFSADAMTVAAKAGANDDPHHGHLDVGTFNLTWQNQSFIGEVPRTSYDEHFFGALRWDYLQARTSGHNVVQVDGEEQVCAKYKDEPWRDGVGGRITRFHAEADWAALALDGSAAYPGKALKGWQRWIALDKTRNLVVVVDRVRCAIGAEIELRFHPGVQFELATDHVILRHAARSAPRDAAPTGRGRAGRAPLRETALPRGELLQLGDSRQPADLLMRPLFAGAFELAAGRQADLPAIQDAMVQWVPYLATRITAPAEVNVIATIFHPADTGAAQFTLEGGDDQPRVSFVDAGRRVEFVFGEALSQTVE